MEIILAVFSILLIISVFLSLVKNDYWVFKLLEYPRLQKLVLMLIIIPCWLFFWPLEKMIYKAVFGGLVVSFIYLLYKIWPYSPFHKKEMLRVRSTDPKNEIKVFALNVFQENRAYDRTLQQIHETGPDIVLLLETDVGWENGVRELEKEYPFTLKAPLDNTYGILFYSRFEMAEGEIRFLVKNDVPSVDAVIVLPSGKKVQLYGLHPEPPFPTESLYSTAKDKELMRVALKVKDCPLPCIVFGDLNDVAWSYTTELFRKTSHMLDPRRGRGFYNTFSAHHWWVKMPLDYIFCTEEFGLISMKRLPKNGSDHYAMITHLALKEEIRHKHDAPQADAEEMEEAREIAN